jgi:hypothetical protein
VGGGGQGDCVMTDPGRGVASSQRGTTPAALLPHPLRHHTIAQRQESAMVRWSAWGADSGAEERAVAHRNLLRRKGQLNWHLRTHPVLGSLPTSPVPAPPPRTRLAACVLTTARVWAQRPRRSYALTSVSPICRPLPVLSLLTTSLASLPGTPTRYPSLLPSPPPVHTYGTKVPP